MALESRTLLATFTVTGTADDGSVGTLRWAIDQANASSAADTIAFSSLFNTPQTIKLSAGQLVLNDLATTTIDGPGANLLAVSVSGGVKSRVFDFPQGSAAISGLTVSGGNAEDGGGLRIDSATVSLADCTISGNTATGDGGGLYNQGTLTMDGCTLNGNIATGNGGGLFNVQAGATLTNCTFSGNTANQGGGLDNDTSGLSLTGCTFSGNTANQGGGLFTYNGLNTLSGCTVSGNTAQNNGGGLYNGTGGYFTLTDCTVSGNTAQNNGGGVVSGYMATTTLVNATVSGNTAKQGGGLYVTATRGGTVTLSNTIIAGQQSGGDITGLVSSASVNNLVGNGAGMTGISNGSGGNLVGTASAPIDPLLSLLGDYGGPNFTMALLPGSPAIGGGTTGSGIPATDQRGQPRTGSVDIGAFQSQGTALVVNTVADGVGSGLGQLTLRQAVNLANALSTADTISFSSLFDTQQTIKLSAGQLVLNDLATTTIDGPGANLLAVSVSGGVKSRVFDFAQGSAALSGLTVSGGNAEVGGGLRIDSATVSLADCTISGNTATGNGGGLYVAVDGTLSLDHCIVENNFAGVLNSLGTFGGGLYNAGGTVTLKDSTVSGNVAQAYGGGVFNDRGAITLSRVAITGNRAKLGGGGLANYTAFGELTLTNCTISGNSAGQGGGLMCYAGTLGFDGPPLTLTNCTISGNSAAANSGGGLYLSIESTTLSNTIVAGNSGGDIRGTLEPVSVKNLVGDGSGMSGISTGRNGNQVGTSQAPIDPLLASLGDYGGPTQTMPVLPGSPAIGGGTSGSRIPSVDQRDEPRTGHVDIGAFQSQGFTLTPVPGSTPQSGPANEPFANPLAVTVTAVNPIEPFDGGIVNFAAPTTGASATLTAATAIIANGQAAVTAAANTTVGSYSVKASAAGNVTPVNFALTNSPLNMVAQPIAAVAGRPFSNVVVATFTDSDPNASPGDFVAAITWGDGITTASTTVSALGPGRFEVLGTHTYVDAGTYTFRVQVTDNSDASAAASSTATVAANASTETPSLVLTTYRDVVDAFDGLTSLREAIAYANSHPGPDTIRFDPAVFGKSPRTIKLTGGPLVLSDKATTTIIGPGARLLCLKGDGKSRVFDIRGGSLALEGVTITGGRALRGGGVRNDGGRLALDHVAIRGNRARVGGGLYNAGTATLTRVVLRGNRALVGSGLFNTRRAILAWRRAPGEGREGTLSSHQSGETRS
jgi:parallel beta-helix repeat protein